MSDTSLTSLSPRQQIKLYLSSESLPSHRTSKTMRTTAKEFIPKQRSKLNIPKKNISIFSSPAQLPSAPQPEIKSYTSVGQYNQTFMPILIQPILPYSQPNVSNEPMLTGTLKFFDETQNYGFFVLDHDGSDLFVHYDDLLKAGLTKENIRIAKVIKSKFAFRLMKYYGKYSLSQKAIDIQLMDCVNMGYGPYNYSQ